jgi:hypothetical protein
MKLTSCVYGAMKQSNGWERQRTHRRDFKHPVRLENRFSNRACRGKYALGMWVPTVILESGRGVLVDAV